MNLYVGNLARTVNEADLQLIFEGFGQIVFAKFADVREDGAKGYAFVYVDNDEQAQTAIDALNGTYLKGARLIVRPVIDRKRDSQVPKNAAASKTGTTALKKQRQQDNHLHLYVITNECITSS
ncbi:MAG TPA: RNA-binding protein [Acidiferrobacterales bacterium]|nr:RNA-binding protein [Acidiferrobacterales bacterium]